MLHVQSSVDDIVSYVGSLEIKGCSFKDYATILKQERVNGKVFLELTLDGFNSIGITDYPRRKHFYDHIQQLKSDARVVNQIKNEPKSISLLTPISNVTNSSSNFQHVIGHNNKTSTQQQFVISNHSNSNVFKSENSSDEIISHLATVSKFSVSNISPNVSESIKPESQDSKKLKIKSETKVKRKIKPENKEKFLIQNSTNFQHKMKKRSIPIKKEKSSATSVVTSNTAATKRSPFEEPAAKKRRIAINKLTVDTSLPFLDVNVRFLLIFVYYMCFRCSI